MDKKNIIIIGLLLLFLLVGGFFAMKFRGDGNPSDQFSEKEENWKSLNEVVENEQLANASVTEITIHKTVDSANYVVFEDEDLIKQWTEFLDSIEVRPVKGAADYFSQADGGRPVVSFKTDKAEIGIVFVTYEGKPVLEIDGKYYEYHTELPLPLEETYDIVKERHGEESHFYK